MMNFIEDIVFANANKIFLVVADFNPVANVITSYSIHYTKLYDFSEKPWVDFLNKFLKK